MSNNLKYSFYKVTKTALIGMKLRMATTKCKVSFQGPEKWFTAKAELSFCPWHQVPNKHTKAYINCSYKIAQAYCCLALTA